MSEYIIKSDEREYNSNSSGDHYTNSLESRVEIMISMIKDMQTRIEELENENNLLQVKLRNYVATI